MREILPDVFVEEIIPIANPPYMNIIIIRGEDRSLLIDAGLPPFSAPAYFPALEACLKELGIPWEKLDCILTHCHRDHTGHAQMLHERNVPLYMNPEEDPKNQQLFASRLGHAEWRKEILDFLGVGLAEPSVYKSFIDFFDQSLVPYRPFENFPTIPFTVGEKKTYGRYTFEAVPLRGHTYGQIGLLERDKRILFCADALMKGITPLVSTCGKPVVFLDLFFETLELCRKEYGDCLFVPGHGPEFKDPRPETDRIVLSYLKKCSVMYDILRAAKEPMTIRAIGRRAYGREGHEPTREQIESCILIWDRTYASLCYMKERDLVREHIEDGISWWTAGDAEWSRDTDVASARTVSFTEPTHG